MSAEIRAAASAGLDPAQIRTWSGAWRACGSDSPEAVSTARLVLALFFHRAARMQRPEMASCRLRNRRW
jgi:hypothetical protein